MGNTQRTKSDCLHESIGMAQDGSAVVVCWDCGEEFISESQLLTDDMIDAMFWPLGPSSARTEEMRAIARGNVKRALEARDGE